MTTENLSVAAAFNLSYEDLAPDQQRLFRRLGLHPGADIDGYAAAALDGTDLAAARRGLEALYDQYLLTEPAPGRYRLHDLIREHARALADRLDPDGDRDQATARLLEYYQYTAARADALIARQARPGPAPADGDGPGRGSRPGRPGASPGWARAERASLLAGLDQATRSGQHARVIALTAGLAGLLQRDGPWAEAVTRHTAAVQAAWYLGDRLGEANALNDLGAVRRLTGDYPAAAQALGQALGIFRDLGDRGGQAEALNETGTLHRVSGDLAQAKGCHQQALELARAIGASWDEAHALAGLGRCALAARHVTQAGVLLRQALEIFRRIGAAEAADLSTELKSLTGAQPSAPGP